MTPDQAAHDLARADLDAEDARLAWVDSPTEENRTVWRRACGEVVMARERYGLAMEALSAGRGALTPREIADLAIPADERVSYLIRLLPTRQTVVFWACALAERTWKARGNDDPRPRAAIDTARRWARGEATADECMATGDAAYTALAFDAAYAAYAADADADAYFCAVQVASNAAVYALHAAGSEAAYAAERRWQLVSLVTLLSAPPRDVGETLGLEAVPR